MLRYDAEKGGCGLVQPVFRKNDGHFRLPITVDSSSRYHLPIMRFRATKKTPASANLVLMLPLLVLVACGLAISDEKRLERAEQALSSGDTRAAVIDTRNILRRNPDNRRARVVLGHALLAQADAVTAEKELRKAIELGVPAEDIALALSRSLLMQSLAADSLELLDEFEASNLARDPEFHRLRGDALRELGDGVLARTQYQQALALDADNTAAQIGVAVSYVRDGNLAQALLTMGEVVGAYPEDFDVRLMAASLYSQAGNFAQAAAHLEAAQMLARAENDSDAEARALHALIEVHLAQGDAKTATGWFEKLSDVAPDAVLTRLAAARIAVQTRNWKEAEELLLAVLTDAPRLVLAKVLLGATYLEVGSAALAEAYLADAVRDAPDHTRARMLLTEARLRLNDSATAQLALDPLLTDDDQDPAALRLAARVSFNAGDTAAAAEYLHQALAREPDNVELRLRVALALITFGEVDEAETLLRTVDSAYHFQGGVLNREVLDILVSLRRGKLDEARRLAVALAEKRPDLAEAHNLLGSVELYRGEFEAARQAFERAVQISGNRVHALRNHAVVDEFAGDLASAALRYQEILELEPGASWAILALSRIAKALGDTEASIDWLRRLVEAEPAAAGNQARLALALFTAGKKPEARELVHALDRTFLVNHLPTAALLGTMLIEEGKTTEASQLARELQQRHPESSVPWALTGEARAAVEDYSAAFEAYSNAVDVAPMKSHAVRAYLLGRRAGRDDSAVPLDRFLEANPGALDVLLLRAEAYRKAGDSTGAAGAYERVLASDPDNFVALNNLAWAYRDDDISRATGLARRASALQPNNASVLDTLGWLLVRQGKLEEGIQRLRDAVEQDGDNPQIWLHLATALAEAGETDEARRLLETLMVRHTDSEAAMSAREILARL